MKTNITNVEDYISQFSEETQTILRKLRTLVLSSAPDAIEKISYGMPGYTLFGKPLVYFAAYEHHIGFYATPSGHDAFAKELATYKQGKGSVQFPLNGKMPWPLIKKMIAFRVKENKEQYNTIRSGKPAK